MKFVYRQMPDFAGIGTHDGTDSEMEQDFWNDEWFGGPVTEPVFV